MPSGDGLAAAACPNPSSPAELEELLTSSGPVPADRRTSRRLPGCPQTIVTGQHRRAACRRAFRQDQRKETRASANLKCQPFVYGSGRDSAADAVPRGSALLCRAPPVRMSRCSGGMCWGLLEDKTAGHGVTHGCHLGVVLP
jgi:hypothetical protein